jgi:hypothetical protein
MLTGNGKGPARKAGAFRIFGIDDHNLTAQCSVVGVGSPVFIVKTENER